MRTMTYNRCAAALAVLLGLCGTPIQTGIAAPEATSTYFDCVPGQVSTFNGTGNYASRAVVFCPSGYVYGQTTIYWFAVSGSDQAGAARALSLFTTAKITGKVLRLYFDPADLSGSAFGCGTSNCRALQGLDLLP